MVEDEITNEHSIDDDSLINSIECKNKKSKVKIVFLFLLGIFLLIYSITEEPMNFVFPLWIFVYLFKEPLKRIVNKLPIWVAYIGLGLIFGLLTEVAAIFSNRNTAPEDRILMSPDPLTDIILGIFFYSFVMIVWYISLRKVKFTKKHVFWLTGLFGTIVEQWSWVTYPPIFVGMFLSIFGFIYGLLVICVYGIFPMLALMLTEDKFSINRKEVKFKHILLAFFLLFVQAAIFGNVICGIFK